MYGLSVYFTGLAGIHFSLLTVPSAIHNNTIPGYNIYPQIAYVLIGFACNRHGRWCGGHPLHALAHKNQSQYRWTICSLCWSPSYHAANVPFSLMSVSYASSDVVHWLFVSSFILFAHTWPTSQCIGVRSALYADTLRDEQNHGTHTTSRILICAKFSYFSSASGSKSTVAIQQKHNTKTFAYANKDACRRQAPYPGDGMKHGFC